jgi:PAS domain S-box-containing protein
MGEIQGLAAELYIRVLLGKGFRNGRDRTTTMQENTKADLEQQLQACKTQIAELAKALQTERTVRQQTQEALQEIERKFRAVFEQTFQFTGLLTTEGILVEANQTALEFGGFLREEVVNRPFWEARWWTISPETQEQLRKAISQAASGQFVRYEVDVLGADNQVVTIDFSLKPVKDEREQVVLLIPEGRDITLLKQAAQQELHQETTNILESITDAFFAVDGDWRFTYVNSQAEQLLHQTRDELLGQTMWNVYPQAIGTTFAHEYHRAMADKVTVHLDEFCVPLNTWYEVHIYPAKNGLSIYFRDLSERKQAETELYQREQTFRALAENAPDIIARVDRHLRYLYVNAAVERITGLSPQECTGKTTQALGMPEALYTLWDENLQQVFITGQERIIEFDFITLNGTRRYYQTRLVPEFAKDGSVASVLTIDRDVTDFKQTEEALRESEALLRTVITNTPIVLYALDSEGRFTLSEGKGLEAHGLQPGEVVGQSVFELHRNQPYILEYLRRVLTGAQETWLGELNGVVYENQASPLRDETGQVIGLIGVATDITERKRAEEQLKASLQEKEALLKEVHHRVKNNLQVISSLLDLQSQRIKDTIALEAFQASQNRIKSIAIIHEKLYQSDNLAKVNLAEYIHTLTNYLLQTYPINPDNITFQLKVDDIFLNLDTIIPCGLIINELISNALKHGFPGNTRGTIWIEVNSVSVEPPEENTHQVTLVIGNDGIKLEDPTNFYRAKSLGFQLVHILVKQLNGQIEIDQSRGTQFKIRFSEQA